MRSTILPAADSLRLVEAVRTHAVGCGLAWLDAN